MGREYQPTADPAWMSLAEAARMLGVGYVTFPKIAPMLGINYREVPGMRGRRYRRADVEAAVARLLGEEEARDRALESRRQYNSGAGSPECHRRHR